MPDDLELPNRSNREDVSVDWMLRPEYQADRSPIHRMVWEKDYPSQLFDATAATVSAEAGDVMDRCLDLVRRHCRAKTLWSSDGIVKESVLDELAGYGYWGLLVSRQYGGLELPFGSFVGFLTRMASIDPTVAALASVHGCIGAVTALQSFGTVAQRQKFLPQLAAGERLSVFALTEPNAGSDLSALSSYAKRSGDQYLVYGEKLFITNLKPGRLVLLICRIEQETAALLCELPDSETGTFRLPSYGLYALKHAENCGLRFDGFSVPSENRLIPAKGSGLSIAYRGLNRARIALCATAAGTMRKMLADLVPWVQHRRTFGRPIGQRQLVRRRLARLASLIVSCDAMAAWAAGLLDAGYRGELEAMTAKVFAADALREAAVEIAMKTHGGRAFLHGHPFGDRLYDYLAPSIYEGESELLQLAFFHSLVKQRDNLQDSFASLERTVTSPLAKPWGDYAALAVQEIRSLRLEIESFQKMHGDGFAEQQAEMVDIVQRIQELIVALCTCHVANASDDELIRIAARISIRALLDESQQDQRDDIDRLGAAIVEGQFSPIADIDPAPICMS